MTTTPKPRSIEQLRREQQFTERISTFKTHTWAFALGFIAAMLTAHHNGLNARPIRTRTQAELDRYYWNNCAKLTREAQQRYERRN